MSSSRHFASYASASANSCSVCARACASSVAGPSPATLLRRAATKPTTTRGTTTTAKMSHGITRPAYSARSECPRRSQLEPRNDHGPLPIAPPRIGQSWMSSGLHGDEIADPERPGEKPDCFSPLSRCCVTRGHERREAGPENAKDQHAPRMLVEWQTRWDERRSRRRSQQ